MLLNLSDLVPGFAICGSLRTWAVTGRAILGGSWQAAGIVIPKRVRHHSEQRCSDKESL